MPDDSLEPPVQTFVELQHDVLRVPLAESSFHAHALPQEWDQAAFTDETFHARHYRMRLERAVRVSPNVAPFRSGHSTRFHLAVRRPTTGPRLPIDTGHVTSLNSVRNMHSRILLALALVVSASGCRTRERSKAAPAKSVAAVASTVTPSMARPYFVKAPERLGAAQPYLAEQVSSAAAAGERVLVYVGATWCEPCERFHEAVEAGELDGMLAGTRFVEFDADRHTEALGGAGYAFRMIPVIALPNPDGGASGRQLTGSIKGPDAVRANLVPRLQALLDGRPVN